MKRYPREDWVGGGAVGTGLLRQARSWNQPTKVLGESAFADIAADPSHSNTRLATRMCMSGRGTLTIYRRLE